ncbi:response regulator transcription factor [Streptomyces niveus]|uniref:response regulator n=1 Tax=Streptomyces niveus TaxID=193462 RepID=UPI00365464AA
MRERAAAAGGGVEYGPVPGGVVRAGFRALLDLTDDLVVVAEAADGARAVEAVRTTRPDVVLMDIRMPGIDGIEATRRIAADRALVSCALAVAVGGGLLPASHPAGEALPALFGIAGSFAVAGLLGLAVGTPVRHSAGAVTSVIGLLSARCSAARGAGSPGLSPTAALEKLTQTSDATAETVGSLGPWPSLWLVAATSDGRPGPVGRGRRVRA